MSALDGAVLERWANCCDMYREALAKINQAGANGMLIQTPSGILRRPWRSPLMDVIRDLALGMKGYEAAMGFTPAARSGISLPADADKEKDPWSEIAG
ncbi:MAG: P27 family phage terminase small subunit [Candidatus Accumulibacter sp. UW20]